MGVSITEETPRDTPEAEQETERRQDAPQKRRRFPVSDMQEGINLGFRLGKVEEKVSQHDGQIATLLATSAESTRLLTTMAQTVGDIQDSIDEEKIGRNSIQEKLDTALADIAETKRTAKSVEQKESEREQRDHRTKEALERAEERVRQERIEMIKTVVTVAKRVSGVGGALVLVMTPSAINSLPPSMHRYLYIILGVLAVLFVLGAVPALLWSRKGATP